MEAAAVSTVDAALRAARGAGVDRLDAQLLLSEVLGRPRSWLIADGDAVLDAAQAARWAALLARRAEGEPLAYILGVKEFAGVALKVDARVLVPRPDTETLVDWAVQILRQRAMPETACVADLGTGSGAIAIAIARLTGAAVTAVERSADALAVAQANAAQFAPGVRCLAGSWWAPLRGTIFDLVVSNPPYVAEGDAHLPALRHEPTEALVAGPDGLGDLRTIVAGAPVHLTDGAWLLLEHGCDQSAAVTQLLADAGFSDVQTRCDLGAQPRVTGGRWRGHQATAERESNASTRAPGGAVRQ